MTCHHAREWLGALVDGAIDPARPVEVEAHLSTCAECRVELEGLRATVGLLRRVEPARAPAGFVDRVMQRARPTPWYRRLAAWLFLPLSVKLPAEAAAIVVVGGLAILLIDRTPELRNAARVEPPAPPPISDAPPQPVPAPPGRAARDASSDKIAQSPPASRAGETRVAPSEQAAPAPPVTRAEETRGASSEQVAPAPVPAAPGEPAQTPATPAARPPVAAPSPRPPAPAEGLDAKRERSQVERKLSAPSVGRSAATAARPADVAGRLEVRDQSAAVAALADLVSKVGGSESARHQDGPDLVIEALIPEARQDEFVRGLEALGTWSGPGLRQRVMLDAPSLRIPIRLVE